MTARGTVSFSIVERAHGVPPLPAKLTAFGWTCRVTDGHDFGALTTAFSELPVREGAPTAIVARTMRGRGVPSLEDRADAWFVRLTAGQADALIEELRQGGAGASMPRAVAACR